ncbi:hypothetical protein QJR26_17445 [Clostridium baratii]
MNIYEIRIYGDNILECEKTLNLIYKSIKINSDSKKANLSFNDRSNLFCPSYTITTNSKKLYKIQLFPGYNRWSSNILDKLTLLGASLTEGADSIVTQIIDSKESILFGCEYCGALPAGNNAWQRSGRALLFAEAKIPFLYYSELGGMELDSDRNIKSARLPNPLVTLSYFTANINYNNSIIAPIYKPSPTISDSNFSLYSNCFVKNEDLNLIYNLITDNIYKCLEITSIIQKKALNLTKLLIENRRVKDTISFKELQHLCYSIADNSSNNFFEKRKDSWKKSISIDLTDKMNRIFTYCKENCLSMGSKKLPFCLVPLHKKNEFISLLNSCYQDNETINKIISSNKPIALVWIAGFKPGGDDSRPDRGLLPLFKMLFGNEYTIISLIFGPMKKFAIKNLLENPYNLISSNGLWKAIYTQSDFLIVDNYIAKRKELGISNIFKTSIYLINPKDIIYNTCSTIPRLGEDDIDTVIHSIFRTVYAPTLLSHINNETFIFESLCNPPGGDWSGIEFLDIDNNILYRWSSLPRVSGKDKRPDHIIQFKDKLLIIESKLHPRDLEKNIGPRLINYVKNLFNIPPICYKKYPLGNWILNDNKNVNIDNYDYLSAVAFTKISSIENMSNNESVSNFSYYSNLFELTKSDIIFDITINSNINFINIACRCNSIKIWVENMINSNKNISFLSKNKKVSINIV